jgi:DNA-binding transcriptional regulator YhcF (GntR family)
MLTPETCNTLEDVAKYKQQSLNSLMVEFADTSLDKLVTFCLKHGYTKQEISEAIKEYINGRD